MWGQEKKLQQVSRDLTTLEEDIERKLQKVSWGRVRWHEMAMGQAFSEVAKSHGLECNIMSDMIEQELGCGYITMTWHLQGQMTQKNLQGVATWSPTEFWLE